MSVTVYMLYMCRNNAVINCPLCSETFKQEPSFAVHMDRVHRVTDLKKYHIDSFCGGVHPKCACGCGVDLVWKNWRSGFSSKYIRGHNARIDSCWIDEDVQRKMIEKRRDGYRSGKYTVWNKGLSKETDSRIDLMSEKIGQSLRKGREEGVIVSWQKDEERKKRAALKMSQTMKSKYASGEIIPWNKGLTKSTSSKLTSIAAAISHYRLMSDKIGRHSMEDVRRIVESTGVFDIKTEFVYQNKYQKFEVVCRNCGKASLKNIGMLQHTPICFHCHPKESKGQLELYEFVRSLASDSLLSDRDVLGGQELDVYVPSKKFAVEFNGLYWHSVSNLPNPVTYHDDKTQLARSVGIRLFHVYEDEWRDKRPIVESMVRNALGLSVRGPGARECGLVFVPREKRRAFFDANHLDGDARSEVCFGLEHKGSLVSAISLRRPFHRSRADRLEVCRFATLVGCVVPGALGRLSKASLTYAVEMGYRGLLSYIDLRHGLGDSYGKVGFIDLTGKPSPRFWWTDYVDRFNRFKFRADKSRGMTQAQVADEAGVVMLWGCSNRVMVLDAQ